MLAFAAPLLSFSENEFKAKQLGEQSEEAKFQEELFRLEQKGREHKTRTAERRKQQEAADRKFRQQNSDALTKARTAAKVPFPEIPDLTPEQQRAAPSRQQQSPAGQKKSAGSPHKDEAKQQPKVEQQPQTKPGKVDKQKARPGRWLDKTCKVTAAGSDSLMLNTYLQAWVTDSNGEVTSYGQYLKLINSSRKYSATYVSGDHAGTLQPGETQLLPIPFDNGPNKTKSTSYQLKVSYFVEDTR